MRRPLPLDTRDEPPPLARVLDGEDPHPLADDAGGRVCTGWRPPMPPTDLAALLSDAQVAVRLRART